MPWPLASIEHVVKELERLTRELRFGRFPKSWQDNYGFWRFVFDFHECDPAFAGAVLTVIEALPDVDG